MVEGQPSKLTQPKNRLGERAERFFWCCHSLFNHFCWLANHRSCNALFGPRAWQPIDGSPPFKFSRHLVGNRYQFEGFACPFGA